MVLSSLADAHQNFGIDAWPKEIMTAGEQLQITPNIRNTFLHHPESRLYNYYGPTEAHGVTTLTLSTNAADWPNLPTIGYPIWNNQIYLLVASLS